LIEALAEVGSSDRLDRAVAAYRAKEITFSRAAELGGLSTWGFLSLMPKEQLDLQMLDQHVPSK
jgi:predicted HTH domain antitoxin